MEQKTIQREWGPQEITLVYAIFSLFFMIIGYVFGKAFSQEGTSLVESFQNMGIMPIFMNNIFFFIIVCLTPYLNIVLCLIQFCNIGKSIYLISELDFSLQFQLLYRHAIFEVFALLLAVFESYLLYQTLRDWLKKGATINKGFWKKYLILFGCIFFLCLCGACLEGSFHV